MKLLLASLVFSLAVPFADAQEDQRPRPEDAGGPQAPAQILDQEMRERLQNVMREANRQPQVLAARKEARAAGAELSAKIRELAGKENPELADKLDGLGFEWMPPRPPRRRPDGRDGGARPNRDRGGPPEGAFPPGRPPRDRDGPQSEGGTDGERGEDDDTKGRKKGPKGRAILKDLTGRERREFRKMIRGIMTDPELRPLRRNADRKWQSFKKVLRAEAERIDPEVMKELEKIRPPRGPGERRERPRRH